MLDVNQKGEKNGYVPHLAIARIWLRKARKWKGFFCRGWKIRWDDLVWIFQLFNDRYRSYTFYIERHISIGDRLTHICQLVQTIIRAHRIAIDRVFLFASKNNKTENLKRAINGTSTKRRKWVLRWEIWHGQCVHFSVAVSVRRN